MKRNFAYRPTKSEGSPLWFWSFRVGSNRASWSHSDDRSEHDGFIRFAMRLPSHTRFDLENTYTRVPAGWSRSTALSRLLLGLYVDKAGPCAPRSVATFLNNVSSWTKLPRLSHPDSLPQTLSIGVFSLFILFILCNGNVGNLILEVSIHRRSQWWDLVVTRSLVRSQSGHLEARLQVLDGIRQLDLVR